MASTNFKIFDENGTNMLSDGDYGSSTQRTNGVQTGVASSQLQNKFQHQMSYMAKAIADMLVAKGININDTENYANFADKFVKQLDSVSYGTTAPNASTYCPKQGYFYIHVVSATEIDVYVSLSTNPATWAPVISGSPISKTVIMTETQSWRVPRAQGQNFSVTVIGAGACRTNAHPYCGGASGAEVKKWSGTIRSGTLVDVTIGRKLFNYGGTDTNTEKYAGSTNANGEASSFGSYVTASGGIAPVDWNGVSASSNGMGGGGGGAYFTSNPNTTHFFKGGNGGIYGGGGGGSGYGGGSYAGEYSNHGGGNGGTYGGGGGGGCINNGISPGGSSGTYGGNGANGVAYGQIASAAQNGTNTIGLGLDFEGQGLAGTTGNFASGAGGGGYGGNGGRNGYSGGGGGGYGGDGGSAPYTGSAIVYNGGGGGGGYGGNGTDGNKGTGNQALGGNGGGYGLNNYGSTRSDGIGNPGLCIVQYITFE